MISWYDDSTNASVRISAWKFDRILGWMVNPPLEGAARLVRAGSAENVLHLRARLTSGSQGEVAERPIHWSPDDRLRLPQAVAV